MKAFCLGKYNLHTQARTEAGKNSTQNVDKSWNAESWEDAHLKIFFLHGGKHWRFLGMKVDESE